jgi:glycosyltransferase involved in cell wall biosynthesis
MRAALACKQLGVPRIQFIESTLESARYTSGAVARVRSSYFRSADAVLCVGTQSRRAAENYGACRALTTQVTNVVDVDHFVRGSEPKGDACTNFLYVGQLIDRKNVHSLIRALANVPSARLTVVGAGPERVPLERLATNIGAQVTFHGPASYDELPDIYAAHECLVLPSMQEVWGLVVNEALAAGLRVIVSQNAGVAAEITGAPGVLLTDHSPNALEAALKRAASGALEPADPMRFRSAPWTVPYFADGVRSAMSLALSSKATG